MANPYAGNKQEDGVRKLLETERLLLKVLDGGAAGAVLDYLQRNSSFLKEWEPERPEDFHTAEYQAAQLEKELSDIESGSMLKYWIFRKENPERVIGSVNFGNIVRGAFQSCFLGYRLDEEEINRGYMTEAVAAGIRVVFGEYKLHRIEANVMPRNIRSLSVVRKLGFREEGLALEYLKINGKWEDHIHMVLLNNNM